MGGRSRQNRLRWRKNPCFSILERLERRDLMTSDFSLIWPMGGNSASTYTEHTPSIMSIDLNGDFGRVDRHAPVFAANSGFADLSEGWNGGYGRNILIDSGNGLKTRVAHLSKAYITDGYVTQDN